MSVVQHLFMAKPYSGPPMINITVSTHQYAYNLFAAAGSPAGIVAVTLTIDPGIVLYGDGVNYYGLEIGAFAVGSIITIINNGVIAGGGGAGGMGGDGIDAPPEHVEQDGLPGLPGNTAIYTIRPIRIDNTNGVIYGGGGGGGGGAADWKGGGGGGGGTGHIAAAGGAGGPGTSGYNGTAGNSGTNSAGGTGGAGGYYPSDGSRAGTGGNGGGWGEAEQIGTYSTPPFAPTPGTGGAAGKAIVTNGNAITWLGGNNSTQVKGPVV